MPVRVAGPGRRDGDLRSHGIHEWLGRRGPTAVVGDLEQVEPREVVGQERRVDRFLDVAGEQEPVATHRSEQHHRDVVDARPAVGRFTWHSAADRPEDPQGDLVDIERIAGRQPEPHRCTRRAQASDPLRVAWPGPDHPRLEDATHPVPREETG